MDLNTLVLLKHIADMGSLAEVARRTGVPKSTLSRKVHELEEELGARVLERNSRTLGLTGAGRVLVAKAELIAAEADAAKREVRALGEDPRGLVRVTCSVSFGEWVVSKVAVAFMKRYPEVQLEFVLSAEQEDLVGRGIDVAIRIGSPETNSALIAKRLAETTVYLCASPDYIERFGAPNDLAELSERRAIVYRTDRTVLSEWSLFDDEGKMEKVRVAPAFTANSYPMALDATRAGLGIGLLPAVICGESVAKGELVRVLRPYQGRTFWVYAAYASREHQPAGVRAFIDFVAENIGDPPWVLD